MGDYIVPILFVSLILIAAIKKKNPYQCMIEGAKEGFSASFGLFPNIMAIFLALTLMQASGLSDMLSRLLARSAAMARHPQRAGRTCGAASRQRQRQSCNAQRRAHQIRSGQLYRSLRDHDCGRMRHCVLHRYHLFRANQSQKHRQSDCYRVVRFFFKLSVGLLAVQDYVKKAVVSTAFVLEAF